MPGHVRDEIVGGQSCEDQNHEPVVPDMKPKGWASSFHRALTKDGQEVLVAMQDGCGERADRDSVQFPFRLTHRVRFPPEA